MPIFGGLGWIRGDMVHRGRVIAGIPLSPYGLGVGWVMNWSEMEEVLTNRVKETLELRDRARRFHDALVSPTTHVEFESSMSLHYGVGVTMRVIGDNGRVVRVSLYPNKILAYLGTRDAQGDWAKTSREGGILSEAISYLQGVPT